jgi:Fe-S-cluster containining protein
MERETLHVLYEAIEARARRASDGRDWPCRRGCDGCCRRLGEIPALTVAEWDELWRGHLALPPAIRADIRSKVERLGAAPVVCPFLDEAQGACRVYAHRPAACRSYGFYRGRAHDAFCAIVEAALPALEAAGDPIVWGNQDALDDDLARRFGPRVGVAEWFAAHPDEEPTDAGR